MRYLRLLYVNAVNTFRRDVAYFAENWSNVLSTLLFTLTAVLAIEAIFTNVNTIGSFDKNDVLFLMFLGQVSFYLIARVSFVPATEFAEEVNSGQLDFYLTRPVPLRFFIYTKSISFLIMVRDSLPPLIPLTFIVDWTALGVTGHSFLAGAVIFLLGMVIEHCMVYMLALTSIWSGSSNHTLSYFWASRAENRMPYENLYGWFQGAVFLGLPALLSSSLAASVMLGYSPAALRLAQVLAATVVWLIVHNYAWKKAMQTYSSASS